MDNAKFIQQFQSQFIDSDEIDVSAETTFRDLESWDSLTGMAVLVMIKDEYGVDMGEQDIKQCHTVQDIIDFVSARAND